MNRLARLRARYSRAALARRRAQARFWDHLGPRTFHPDLAAGPEFVALSWSKHVLDLRTDRTRPLMDAIPGGLDADPERTVAMADWTATWWSSQDQRGYPQRPGGAWAAKDLYVALTAPDGTRTGVIVSNPGGRLDRHHLGDLLDIFPIIDAHLDARMTQRLATVHAALTNPHAWTGLDLREDERAEALRALPGLASPDRPTWAHARPWYRIGADTDRTVDDWLGYFNNARAAFRWALWIPSPMSARLYHYRFDTPAEGALWYQHARDLWAEDAAVLHQLGWQPPTFHHARRLAETYLSRQNESPTRQDLDTQVVAMASIKGMTPAATLAALDAGMSVPEVTEAMAQPGGVDWNSVRAMTALGADF